jgi:hypothetical protein
MLQLLNVREALFARQRFLANCASSLCQHQVMLTLRPLYTAPLQHDSWLATMQHLSVFPPANAVPRNSFTAYVRFCSSLDIPPFPLTSLTIALAVFSKCSVKDGHYTTFVNELERVRNRTCEIWEDADKEEWEEVYEEILEFDKEGAALKEFMKERKAGLAASVSASFPFDY